MNTVNGSNTFKHPNSFRKRRVIKTEEWTFTTRTIFVFLKKSPQMVLYQKEIYISNLKFNKCTRLLR